MEFTKTYKKTLKIGEYVSLLGNYSISELKLCRNLTYAKQKMDLLVPLIVPYNLREKIS